MDIIKSIQHEQLKSKVPVINIGDTVRVHVRVKEGTRERIQVFEGIVIKKQGGGTGATFTVRRISYGVGVEKTFLVHSPKVEKVEVKRAGKVRRAKLYYLRDRVGKSAKTKENIGGKIGVLEEGEDEIPETQETLVEEVIAEEVPAVENTVEEPIKEEKPVKEAKTEKVEEKPAKEVKTEKPEKIEEKPAEAKPEQVVEEVVDTVKEETVEVVKEKTPVKAEKVEEKSAEKESKDTKKE